MYNKYNLGMLLKRFYINYAPALTPDNLCGVRNNEVIYRQSSMRRVEHV